MVEPETIRRRLGLLQDALADLQRYRARYDEKSLVADRDVQHMVSHAMYVAVQASIDVALHVAADVEQPTSTTYQQAFEASTMRGSPPRWRNELPDLEQFAAAAASWL